MNSVHVQLLFLQYPEKSFQKQDIEPSFSKMELIMEEVEKVN